MTDAFAVDAAADAALVIPRATAFRALNLIWIFWPLLFQKTGSSEPRWEARKTA